MAKALSDFADPDKTALTSRLFPSVVQNASRLSGASQALKQRWFGSKWNDAAAPLNKITMFLKGDNTVRFQKQSAAGLYGSVWNTVQAPYLKGTQKTTVGSTVLVYLQDAYFASGDDEKANTIFHELTHKLILTDDALGYEPDELVAAASKNPAAAIKNAENWTQFYSEFVSGATSSGSGGARPVTSRRSPRALSRRCGG